MADSLGYSIFLDPVDTVRAWKARRQLQPTVRWSEMMHEQHAVAFTVAKIAKLDVLRQVQASLDGVIRNGGTFEEWKSGIMPELQRAGWWGAVRNADLTGTDQTVLVNERRLRTIYDTNVRMSLATGNWLRVQRQKDVLPFLRYLASTSEHKRPLHKLWYGVTLPVDHPWWQTHFPPNGWGCKCNYRQISQREMDRKGWSITPEDQIAGGPPQEFIPAVGDPIMVPAGIDPGFSYNPGTAHLRAAAAKAANSIQQALDVGLEEAARQTLQEIVADAAFEQFYASSRANFPVMILGDDLKNAISSKARVAVLSGQTMDKQAGRHPEINLQIYRQLPDLPDHADIIARDGENILIMARQSDGSWIIAIVKRTASGEGLFVTSVRKQNEASLKRLLRDTEIIVDRRQ